MSPQENRIFGTIREGSVRLNYQIESQQGVAAKVSLKVGPPESEMRAKTERVSSGVLPSPEASPSSGAPPSSEVPPSPETPPSAEASPSAEVLPLSEVPPSSEAPPVDPDEWIARGQVTNENGQGMAGLTVSIYDKDLFFDDRLGIARTNEQGHFRISYRTEDFRDLIEAKPDLYLKVMDDDGGILYDSEGAVRFESGRDEVFDITIRSH